MNEEASVLRIKLIEVKQENARLKRALALWADFSMDASSMYESRAIWADFSMDASSMYESTLRYKINSVSGKVREILNEPNK